MSGQRDSVKRRLEEIDVTLDKLTRSLEEMNGMQAEIENRIKSIRLKREKTQALAAVAKSQKILAEMEILIARNDVNNELEKLKSYQKKMKYLSRDNVNGGTNHKQSQKHSEKSSQSKKVSTKVKPKKPDDKKKNATNIQRPISNCNQTKEHANSAQIKNKHFENRALPNPNTSSENKNKTSTSNASQKDENVFKIPIIGQKTTRKDESCAENVSRRISPALISQSRQHGEAKSSFIKDNPFKLLFAGEPAMSELNFFSKISSTPTEDTQHHDMVNDLFRELMCCSSSTPKRIKLDTSMSSWTTANLEEILS